MGRLLLVLVAVALALFITVAKATHCISNIDCVEVGETCTASEAFDACGADGLPACRACSKSICDDALGVCRAPADLGQPCGAATTDAICSPNDRDEGYPGDEW